MNEPEILSINAFENIKAEGVFGRGGQPPSPQEQKLDRQLKGIGGTLHLTNKEDCDKIISLGWQLSENTGKPVVIVIRAPSKA